MSDEYRPRPHDHVVEPMFGGLGVEDTRARRPLELPAAPSVWRRLWRVLVRLFRRPA